MTVDEALRNDICIKCLSRKRGKDSSVCLQCEPKKANERQIGGTHYAAPIQHWDYVLANDIPYLEAQVIRYLTRWRKKGGLQDVYKAKHFLDKLIEVEELAAAHNQAVKAGVIPFSGPHPDGAVARAARMNSIEDQL